MKLRIESDGKGYNTKVMNAETGEIIERVTSVKIVIDPRSAVKAVIEVSQPKLDIIAEETVVQGRIGRSA